MICEVKFEAVIHWCAQILTCEKLGCVGNISKTFNFVTTVLREKQKKLLTKNFTRNQVNADHFSKDAAGLKKKFY